MPALQTSQEDDEEPTGLCHNCAWLTVRRIIGNNRLGLTLRKSYGDAQGDADSCRLCRMLVKALDDANEGVELRISDKIRLQPHGKSRKFKHLQLYALSVHLMAGGQKPPKAGRDYAPEVKPGMLSMYTEEGNAASDSATPAGPIAGRVVREASDLKTLKYWLNHCLDKHPYTCTSNSMYHRRSLVFLDDGFEHRLLPTRTVDVGHDASGDTVYLREHHDGERAPYIALSYCWGEERDLIKTTTETIDKHKTGIKISALPQTFQDAIAITRELSIQYLWIDALCILQDSQDDWKHEAGLMGALYAGAHLTIAALSSSSASGGLFFDRGLTSEVVELPLGGNGQDQDRTVKVSLRSCLSTSVSPIKLEEEAHSKRAWTLQERLLSPRVLYCGKLQYYWECREMKRAEDGSKFPDGVMADHNQRPQSLIGSLAKARPRAALDLWYEVVQTYSWRSLTFAQDKLTALDGLVKTFSPYTNSSYVAGMWMSDLTQALAWRRSRRCSRLVRPNRARAPSWSWASCDGGLNHLNQRVYLNYPPPAWRSRLQIYITGQLSTMASKDFNVEGLAPDAICLKVDAPVVTKQTMRVKDLLRTTAVIYMDASEDHNQDIASPTGKLSCMILADVPEAPRRAQGLLLREISDGLHERAGLVDIREYQPLASRLETRTLLIV